MPFPASFTMNVLRFETTFQLKGSDYSFALWQAFLLLLVTTEFPWSKRRLQSTGLLWLQVQRLPKTDTLIGEKIRIEKSE